MVISIYCILLIVVNHADSFGYGQYRNAINNNNKAGGEGTWTPLVNIINLSFETGSFPVGLKEEALKPLFKKPTLDPMEPVNYNPVSTPW